MNLVEFYNAIGGGYEDVMSRLLTEKRVYKYVSKFASTEEFANTLAALDAGLAEDAFKASHNLKGVCLNLGLGNLSKSAVALCDSLRGGVIPENIGELRKKLEDDYRLVTELIPRIAPVL